ncbi:hypothetical protein A5773_01810 [Mycobacterium sp. 852014-52450_SCH5900713]|nr:hypothetical protein A5773_01810 [Mycobacterium sp. 852014-52450_SCH5900713]
MRTTLPASWLHSPDFEDGDPHPAYRELRATAPVCWSGGAYAIQRDIISMAGLGMPSAPRDLRATTT